MNDERAPLWKGRRDEIFDEVEKLSNRTRGTGAIRVMGADAVMLPFGEYKPDLSNFNGQTTQLALNVVPRADGYGPWKALTPVTASLPAASRGTFYARKTDGTIVVFAGTSTRLYKLDNTTLAWTDVSKGAVAYSALPSTDHWGFAQFGNLVIAVQANTVPQVYDISSGSAFADLGGSPPQARYAAVVGRFLVLSGLLSTPYRIQWSGLNAITTWTPGVNSSDFQDFPDGGVVRGVAGGEFGVIFQDSVIRRMVYAVGASYVFKIDRIAEDKGLLAPYSPHSRRRQDFLSRQSGLPRHARHRCAGTDRQGEIRSHVLRRLRPGAAAADHRRLGSRE